MQTTLEISDVIPNTTSLKVEVTTFITVAYNCGKQHKNVIRDIKSLQCSEDFRRLNFEASFYNNEQSKKQPLYNITKEGFILLMSKYTGKKARIFFEQLSVIFKKTTEVVAVQSDLLNYNIYFIQRPFNVLSHISFELAISKELIEEQEVFIEQVKPKVNYKSL